MSNLQDWRNSFRLVPNNDIVPNGCKKGQTFRTTSRHASVEFGQSSTSCPTRFPNGSAKPGPTAIRDSSLVRRRKIQVRTKSNKTGNSASGINLKEHLEDIILMLRMVEMDTLVANAHSYLDMKIEMQMFLRLVFEVMQVMLFTLSQFLRN